MNLDYQKPQSFSIPVFDAGSVINPRRRFLRKKLSFSQMQKLRRHTVFNALVSALENPKDATNAPFFLYRKLKSENRENLIFTNRVVRIPGTLEAALIANEMAEKFDVGDLILSNIFIKISRMIDGQTFSAWRLCLTNHHERRGFIVPIIKNGLIDTLRVFRFPDDPKPFTLQNRGGLCNE